MVMGILPTDPNGDSVETQVVVRCFRSSEGQPMMVQVECGDMRPFSIHAGLMGDDAALSAGYVVTELLRKFFARDDAWTRP